MVCVDICASFGGKRGGEGRGEGEGVSRESTVVHLGYQQQGMAGGGLGGWQRMVAG